MWKCTHSSLEMDTEMQLALQAHMLLCRNLQDKIGLHCLQVHSERLIIDLTLNVMYWLPWGRIMQGFAAEGCTDHCEESHWLRFWKNLLCKREVKFGIVEQTHQMISNVVSKSCQKLQKWLWQVSKLLSKRFFSVLIEITRLSFVSFKAVMDKFLKYEKAGGSLKLYKFSFFLLQHVVKTV